MDHDGRQISLSGAVFKVLNHRGGGEDSQLYFLFDWRCSVHGVSSCLLPHESPAGEAGISVHLYREGSEGERGHVTCPRSPCGEGGALVFYLWIELLTFNLSPP